MAALTRDRIIDAARVEVESHGYEAVSLRAVARALGVTAPALYDHVSSKDELLRAVAGLGYAGLADGFEVDGVRAIDRCRARAIAYVDFARANPELFRLMFLYRPAAIPIEADNELAAATETFETGNADLQQAIDDGDLAGPDATGVSLRLWAAVHGVASISLTAPALASEIVDDVVDAMLVGLAPTPSIQETP